MMSPETAGPITKYYYGLPSERKPLLRQSWDNKVYRVARKIKKVGQDDPRRIVHGLKVGLALTLASLLLFYIKPFDLLDEDQNGIWAIMTIVLIFEFSVGATLGKGLNRMVATSSAAALGVGIHKIAIRSSGAGRATVIGFFVFTMGAICTFMRFVPAFKPYDYGLMIFILTFSMVSVAGYQPENWGKNVQDRIVTIIIGSVIAIVVCIFICPVWNGEDLQNLIAKNIEKLGNFLEGFKDEYFHKGEYFPKSEDGQPLDNKPFLKGYKSVLTSKSSEETMAYEFRSKIQEQCKQICSETGKALKELASAVKTMTKPTSVNIHIEKSKVASRKLKLLLDIILLEDYNLREIIPPAAVALILIDVVPCIEKIANAVHELAYLAHFKTPDSILSP
ncbi:aluminum-activated malate transporter 8-like isoform X2 [Quercus robur]|uniref:aluminum-activated malate transporter 8-like isoform X2 n=1 Tax=Quercus robur TaxID=38942 RepID=UPI00216303E7|nr:aluminum-activated malate transporter 8-like isoform X2 [Quercus robur]